MRGEVIDLPHFDVDPDGKCRIRWTKRLGASRTSETGRNRSFYQRESPMKNVFRVGFCVVAAAMTMGCMAEAMDEVVEEASAAVAPTTCAYDAPADVTLSVSPNMWASTSSKSPNGNYGTATCPNQYVAALNFPSNPFNANAWARPVTMPTTKAACENTFVEITRFERWINTHLGINVWVPVDTDTVRGEWVDVGLLGTPHWACELEARLPYRKPLPYGNRIAGAVYTAQGVHQRVEVGVSNWGILW